MAAWRGATGLCATSPPQAQAHHASGFPLLSLAVVQTVVTLVIIRKRN